MNEWHTHFIKQLNGTVDRIVHRSVTDQLNPDTPEDITENEVVKQITKMKKRKAAGEDGLPNEVWLHCSRNVIQKLTEIINNAWKGKGFPRNWRKGVIVPIHKKGDRHNAQNYRGVTLLDTAYKIYATILEDKLRQEIDEKNLLPDNQAGFRRGRGTIDNIYILNYAIQKELKETKGKLYVLFADLKAAFDTVNRKTLLKKMEHAQISSNLRARIAEIYEETINTIKINNEETDEFWTSQGVRQGCPLSPTLFALYMADLEEHLTKGQTGGTVIGKQKFWSLSYADDVVLVARSAEELRSLITRFGKYLKNNDLTMNTDKTKIIRFSKGRGREPNEKWQCEGKEIEKVKSFKYLGYTFQKNGEEGEHIREVVKKAQIAMAQAWGIGQRNFKDNFRLRMFLFDKLVTPILMYGSEIWGWAEQEHIEKTQLKYIRWVLGLNTQTPAHIILEETKRIKLGLEAGRRAMSYEERIRVSTIKKLAFDCWEETKKKDRTGQPKNHWEIKRQKFYERHGFSTNEIETRRNEGQNTISEIIARDLEIQIQNRRDKIDRSRYNPRYKHQITQDQPEYIRRETKNQSLIARFRTGNEENNNKYWTNKEERRCRICHQGEETIDHLRRDCAESLRNEKSAFSILNDRQPDLEWMRNVIKKRENAQ